jgi:hypothetical protein
MGKRKNSASDEYNDTAITLLVALFGGACAFITVESTFEDLLELFGHQTGKLTRWQLHMGSLSVAFITFVFFVFVLAVLETKSRTIAWRSSAPWLPLAALPALAVVIHIPSYVVLPAVILYGIWAYRRTCSVRRAPRSP